VTKPHWPGPFSTPTHFFVNSTDRKQHWGSIVLMACPILHGPWGKLNPLMRINRCPSFSKAFTAMLKRPRNLWELLRWLVSMVQSHCLIRKLKADSIPDSFNCYQSEEWWCQYYVTFGSGDHGRSEGQRGPEKRVFLNEKRKAVNWRCNRSPEVPTDWQWSDALPFCGIELR
jgi:hypothetical protein